MIWSTGGFIFGGFSDKLWSFSGKWCKYDKSFLLSLKSPSIEADPTKMRINHKKCSNVIFDHYYYGTIFGGGHDLCIKSDSNNNRNSLSNLGNTYELPPGQTNTFLVVTKKSKYQRLRCFVSFDNSYFGVI